MTRRYTMKINTFLTEVLKQEQLNGIENAPKKSKDWIEKRDKCLVEILKKMNEDKK